MSREITIRKVTSTDLEKVLPLIGEYQKFYGALPDLQRNRAFFSSFFAMPDRAIQFWAAGPQGEALGFVTLYFLLSSLSARLSCTLNDLYTVPSARGTGVGRALIAHAKGYALERGHDSMEWMTHVSNSRAQRLYDALPTQKSEWYYYVLPTT